MKEADLKQKIFNLEQEIYLLRQENRGLKKKIKKIMPTFKIERDDDIHNIVISFLNDGTYEPYIIFNLDIGRLDNEIVEYLSKEIYENLMEHEYE